MILLRRLCSVLLCVSLLCIACSISSYAVAIPEDFTADNIEIYTNPDGSECPPPSNLLRSIPSGLTWTVRSTYNLTDPINYFSYSNRIIDLGTFTPPITVNNGAYVPYSYSGGYFNMSFASPSNLNIPKGSTTLISFNNVTVLLSLTDGMGTPVYDGSLSAQKIYCTHLRIVYDDNTTEILYDVEGLASTGDKLSFTYTITDNLKAIRQIMVCFWWDNGSITGIDDLIANGTYNSDYSMYVGFTLNNTNALIDFDESERSLLSSIKDGITELPTKIWDKISNGLKELFIPSEEDLTAIKDSFDTMLSERFGALYEVGGIISDFAESFEFTELKNTIELPVISLDFGDASWEFGGYTVDVVPDNFQFLVDMLKTLISICCIALFINAMKHKYDKLVGGAHV